MAARYDLLNRIISLGLDSSWRRRVAEEFPEGEGLHWLDLAVGTGDQILTCVREGVHHGAIVGVDISEEMLQIAERKLEPLQVDLVEANAADLPFSADQFDVITCAFGVRNFSDLTRSLSEINRVLKPGGRFIVLELSVPTNPLISPFYRLYSRFVIPLWGHLLARQFRSYRYLTDSIEQFPEPAQFCQLLKRAGFEKVRMKPMFFGVCSIYVAQVSE